MDPERRSQVSPRTVWTIGLNLVAMAVLLLLLYHAREVLTWILIALFLAVALDPAVSRLERRGMKRGWAVFAVFAVLLLVLSAVGLVFVPVLVEQGQSLIAASPQILETVRNHWLVQWADSRVGLLQRVQREWAGYAPTAASSVISFVTGFFKGIFALGTILVVTVFMLLFGPPIHEKGLALVAPAARRERYRELAGRMRGAVSGYVAGVLLVALIAGVVTTLLLLATGVPYFLPLGLLVMLLDIVPYVGNLAAGTILIATAYATTGLQTGTIVTVAFLVYMQVENHLVQPMVQRRTIEMNPLVIVLVMLIGTSLSGILGAIFALPVAGAVQAVLEDVIARRTAENAWKREGEGPQK